MLRIPFRSDNVEERQIFFYRSDKLAITKNFLELEKN